MSTMQPFSKSRIGFIPPMYWGGGADGDGRDMTGSAPLRSARSFLADCSGHESGANLREMAIEFTTPEDLCIAIEEEMADRRNGVGKPAREPVIHVNGLTLEDFLVGKSGPIVQSSLFLFAARPHRNRRRRRRGGRGRGNGHTDNGRR